MTKKHSQLNRQNSTMVIAQRAPAEDALTVLLTLGRLPKALDLARGFAACGARVLIADPHRRHLTGLSRATSQSFQTPAPRDDPSAYRDRLLDIIDREGVDLVVPVSEETLHVIPLLASAECPARVFGPTTEALRTLHDKLAFARLAGALKLAVPASYAAHRGEAAELCRRTATILKARASCAGDGLERLPLGTQPPPEKQTHRWIIQEQVAGEVHCSLSLVFNGEVVTTVAYRGPVQSGTVAVVFERLTDPSHYHDFAQRIAKATGYHGFLAFDFIASADQEPVAIECNPRVTSGIHFFNSTDLAAAILRQDPAAEIRAARASMQQQFYPALTETQQLVLAGNPQWRAALKHLLSARDVTFRWRDPLPFLLMPYAAWPIMVEAMFGKLSFGEAATRDIEWDADELVEL